MAESMLELRRDQLLQYDTQKVSRTAEVGTQLSFNVAAEKTSRLQALLSEVDMGVLHYVPDSMVSELQATLEQYITNLDKIERFSSTSPNAMNERNGMEGAAANIYRDAVQQAIPILTITNAFGAGRTLQSQLMNLRTDEALRAEQLIAGIEQRANQSQEAVEIAKTAAKLQATNLKELLESLRADAADFVATKSAHHFDTAAGKYKVSAGRWLLTLSLAAIALLVLAITFLIIATYGIYKGEDSSTAAQVTLAKLALFGLLAFAVSACAKNYYAARHNQTVNEHRSNAISSYKSLMEATSTPEHKDIVLTQVSQAVFAPQDTAFVKNASSMPELPTNIINAFGKP